jgi:hypothetical protein
VGSASSRRSASRWRFDRADSAQAGRPVLILLLSRSTPWRHALSRSARTTASRGVRTPSFASRRASRSRTACRLRNSSHASWAQRPQADQLGQLGDRLKRVAAARTEIVGVIVCRPVKPDARSTPQALEIGHHRLLDRSRRTRARQPSPQRRYSEPLGGCVDLAKRVLAGPAAREGRLPRETLASERSGVGGPLPVVRPKPQSASTPPLRTERLVLSARASA